MTLVMGGVVLGAASGPVCPVSLSHIATQTGARSVPPSAGHSYTKSHISYKISHNKSSSPPPLPFTSN